MPKSRKSWAQRPGGETLKAKAGRLEIGSDPAEQQAWDAVLTAAQKALNFWNSFIGLQSGTDPLSTDALARLLCIVRAVSWVESRHGTGAGSSASADPMQCANPSDSWWRELTDCTRPQDRFVGGTGKANYNACELPDKAAADSTFPPEAKLSNLSDPASGHDDANFRSAGKLPFMSYGWGIPFLIQKINKTAG